MQGYMPEAVPARRFALAGGRPLAESLALQLLF